MAFYSVAELLQKAQNPDSKTVLIFHVSLMKRGPSGSLQVQREQSGPGFLTEPFYFFF